jgi:hypothetical protein
MLSEIILTVVMLSDVMLSVKAPIFAVRLMFPLFKTNSKLGWGEPRQEVWMELKLLRLKRPILLRIFSYSLTATVPSDNFLVTALSLDHPYYSFYSIVLVV